jgi:hypothetical protein
VAGAQELSVFGYYREPGGNKISSQIIKKIFDNPRTIGYWLIDGFKCYFKLFVIQ